MRICDQHLKVAVIASFKYFCSSNQETDFVFDLSKKQRRLCTGCARHYCQEMVAFFKFVILMANKSCIFL